MPRPEPPQPAPVGHRWEVADATDWRVQRGKRGGDMRIEIVKREINQGALAGLGSEITDYAARLIVAALDSYDEHLEAEAFRRGFETGELNAHLRLADPDQSLRPVDEGRDIVLLACGHWIQPEIVDPGTRTWLCPFGDLTQPAARTDEAGTPAVIGSWDYA